MNSDEQQLRDTVQRWLDATAARDTKTVLSMVANDVVFLTPGRPPMNKAEFAAIAAEQAKPEGPAIKGLSEIQEVQVMGDWAFIWTRLKVTVSPPGNAAPVVRAGHTLTLFRREGGRWLLARDANLLSPVKA